MTLPIDAPMVSPVIVGRAAHLAALDDRLDQLKTGSGGTVLVSGEAGVGKTRLVSELGCSALSGDIRFLHLRCFEPDIALPYAPLVALLETANRSFQANGLALTDIPLALAEFSPGKGRTGTEKSSQSGGEEPQNRRDLNAAWVEFVERLASFSPFVLVVDDIHWVDDATLDTLLLIARRARELPMFLVATYRENEVAPGLGTLLSQLDRERLAAEIRLNRLSQPEVDAQLRAIFRQSHPIRPDFLQPVFELTDGNPFFVEEVVRALVAAGDIYQAAGRWERRSALQLRIPRNVQAAVQQHANSLTAEAKNLLNLASVSGRFFEFDVLSAITGHDDAALISLIRELIAAQLVVETSTDRFTFRHALTRQAVYSELLGRERRTLHLQTADSILALHGADAESQFADLAFHFYAAEAWSEAIRFGALAGARALSLFAPRAAIEHFSHSLESSERLGRPEDPRLRRERAQALSTVGEFDRAAEDLDKALELARAAGNRGEEWHALIEQANLWCGRDYTIAPEELTLKHLRSPARAESRPRSPRT